MSRPRLVVSMTTSPRRIQLFRPVIESVFNQTILPDCFHLHLPERYRGETAYEIPDWLAKENRITRQQHAQDWGPVMKILPTLERETEAEAIIITLDDDVRVPADALEQMTAASMEHPDTAFCSRGFNFDRNTHHIRPVRGRLQSCDVLQGYSGCCYRRSHFDSMTLLKQLKALPTIFRFSDDILLSNHIAGRGIKRATIAFLSGNLEFMPWSDDDPDALKRIDGGTHGRYQVLRQHLQSEDNWHLS